MQVDPLLGNDREISNYATAASRQRPENSNRGKVYSVLSAPRCYKQDKLVEWVCFWLSELVRGALGFSSYELLVWEAGSWGRGRFGNPEEGERLSLEAANKQRQQRRDSTFVCVFNSDL
jgi:hypothetical protein